MNREKMRKSKKSKLVLFLLISSFLLGFGFLSMQNTFDANFEDNFDASKETPKVAQLSHSDVKKSRDEVYRLFESINISVNVSDFSDEGVDRVDIKFTYQDNTEETFFVNNYSNYIYNFSFTPFYNTPIGFTDVGFLIKDGVNLIKEESSVTNFTIKSNYVLDRNKEQIYRDQTLYGELIVTNITDTYFDWNVTVAYSTSTTVDRTNFKLGYNISQFSFKINNSFQAGDPPESQYPDYWIKLQILNKTDHSINKSAFYKFTILTENTNPVINATSINFNPEPLYRTKECNLTFDVTDAETATSNLDVSILIEGPELERLDFNTNDLNLTGSNTFSVNFTISADQSVGTYEVEITATDGAGASDTETAYLKVINNPPKINSFKINGKDINESITLNYGETLRFTFNVSDKEGIDYVTVALFNEEAGWFNITQQYITNMNMTIRTVDLAQGTWNVYVFVTDIDGETSGLSEDYNIAPKQIKIVRRTVEGVVPWVMLIMGLVLGGLISIGFASTWMKARWKRKETKEFKKEEPKSTRKSKKKTKKKTVKKAEEKVSEEAGEEKEEKKEKKQTQRKIKRKL
jgi:hypothetical protein